MRLIARSCRAAGCIDAHFTAFQVLDKESCIYYDPLKPSLTHVHGADSFRRFALFHLLKCNYADNSHIQENKNYYTGADATPTRRIIYKLWQNILKLDVGMVDGQMRTRQVGLNLDRYCLVNNPRDPRLMSTQQTGNTCYFQTYLFAVLCKVGRCSLGADGVSVDVHDAEPLQQVCVAMSQFLLQFFFSEGPPPVLRALTNSNVVLDFRRFEQASYYRVITHFLTKLQLPVPEYEEQHRSWL